MDCGVLEIVSWWNHGHGCLIIKCLHKKNWFQSYEAHLYMRLIWLVFYCKQWERIEVRFHSLTHAFHQHGFQRSFLGSWKSLWNFFRSDESISSSKRSTWGGRREVSKTFSWLTSVILLSLWSDKMRSYGRYTRPITSTCFHCTNFASCMNAVRTSWDPGKIREVPTQKCIAIPLVFVSKWAQSDCDAHQSERGGLSLDLY